MPVRLGSDAFTSKHIPLELGEELAKTLHAYRLLMEVYHVNDYMACATSALREAKNGPEILALAREISGLDVKLINGNEEAELIYSTHVAEGLSNAHSYLYIDVGGGSTELTIFSHGLKLAARSFRIGTIRLLENIVEENEWEELNKWLNENAIPLKDISAIGTGGNINKVFKLSGKKDGKPLLQSNLLHYLKYLESYTLEERIAELGMRPDRADVIVPALHIYHRIMKWAGIHEIYVPKVGLADGMIRQTYERYMQNMEKQ